MPRYQEIEMDDVFLWDYPDFCDAYIAQAYYLDGTPLTEQELEELNEDHAFVHEKAHESIQGKY